MDPRSVSVEIGMISRNLRALRRAQLSSGQLTPVSNEGRSLLTLALALPDGADLEAWLVTDRDAMILVAQVNDALRNANVRATDRARAAGWPEPTSSSAPESPAINGLRALGFVVSTALPRFEHELGPSGRSIHPRSRIRITEGRWLRVDEVVMHHSGFTVAARFVLKHRISATDSASPTPMWRGFDRVEDDLGHLYAVHPIRGSANRVRAAWELPLFSLLVPAVEPGAKELIFHVASGSVTWHNEAGPAGPTNPEELIASTEASWHLQL